MTALLFVGLLIVSGLPIFLDETSTNVSAAAPTITNYGAAPTNGEAGCTEEFWLTYTDADNDPPTYVRVFLLGATSPVNNMIGNGSDDTDYTDGKTYYYHWYYFPYLGTAVIMKMTVKSGADPEVSKLVPITVRPRLRLTHLGVAPISDQPGNFTFFANYSSVFNYAPKYMQVRINGTDYDMTKNNSADSTYIDGVNYSYSRNLTAGNTSFSFHANDITGFSDITTGEYWVILETPGEDVSFAAIAFIALIAAIIAALVYVVIK